MSMQLIQRIETRLQSMSSMDEAARRELLALLKELKKEMAALDRAQDDHAESIAGFAGAAAHEAMRAKRNPDLLKLAVDGLAASVKDVETDYPHLVEIVNGICTMLSDLGI